MTFKEKTASLIELEIRTFPESFSLTGTISFKLSERRLRCHLDAFLDTSSILTST